MISVLILSLVLALDALAVSIAEGAMVHKGEMNLALRLACVFGGFQAGMAFFGAFLNILFSSVLNQVDHWLAFGIFCVLGLKMIQDGLSEKDKKLAFLSWKVLLLLGLATSIDALAAGMTLELLSVPILASVLCIGAVTFILCLLGGLLGMSLKKLLVKVPLEILGGCFLIVLGVETLVTNL